MPWIDIPSFISNLESAISENISEICGDVVVTDVEQVTLAPVDALNPVAGDHIYVVAPVAAIVVVEPLHIAVLPTVVFIVGAGLTVNVPVAFVAQPVTVFVPVTVYTVVTVGDAVTIPPVVAESVAPGVQV